MDRPRKTSRVQPPSLRKIESLRRENKVLKEWQRRLSILLGYAKKISAETELDRLLQLLMDEAKRVLQADRCTVFLLDKKRNELWSRMASGNEVIRVPAYKGIVGETVTSGRTIHIPDAYGDSRFNKEIDRITGYHTRNLLTAPMRNNRREIIGAFQVLNKKRGSFTPQDEKILLIFADQAAVAIENTRLYEEVRHASQDTIIRLASAAEYKDKDTRNHLERMSRYCALIAEQMDMPKSFIEDILLASPMHDIGKLGVADAILKKPGKLEAVEWTEIKRHPIYGADILRNSDNDLIQMSERIARSHHEKWDGSGYPLGLKKEEIPLEGRIVALADVFDALTSKRCYKDALPIEETLKIIREGAGTHFDPDVVSAFYRALPKIMKVMDDFADKYKSSSDEGPAKVPLHSSVTQQ
ncbi:MAG TPA: GAF domain-containing protein [Elusimicrobiota bacterium]|nr:GAF domain-containing protein [Elusimicrobiota bacterium]